MSLTINSNDVLFEHPLSLSLALPGAVALLPETPSTVSTISVLLAR